jgi:hypothetical protein
MSGRILSALEVKNYQEYMQQYPEPLDLAWRDAFAQEKPQAPESTAAQVKSALDTQVGGSHYDQGGIQPIEFIHSNQIPFCEANIIKYIFRWKKKNGMQDLNKVRHYLDLLIELETKLGTFDSK